MPPTTVHPAPPHDLIVIGAGLGGLLTAVATSRQVPDARILVLDPHPPGGRARVDRIDGFALNRGPRALYRRGPAERALRSVGVDLDGGSKPQPTDALALWHGEVHRFPATAAASLRTDLLTPKEKVRLSTAMSALWRARTAAPSRTVADWLDERGLDGPVRGMLEALVRVATYTQAPDLLSAPAALHQARLGINPGVRYLDGGWQPLVDQLLRLAADAGITVTAAAAAQVTADADGPAGAVVVTTADGTEHVARSVAVAAGGPDAAAGLLGGRPASWAPLGPAVTAACLELGVARPPRHRFALGLDEPLYASTHCPPAELAPPGMAVVHLMRYQRPGEDVPAADQRSRLRRLAAEVGVAERDIVAERFLARMVVSGALPAASSGGLAGRAPVEVAEHPGVLLVGDWVGPEGLLLDAVAASATTAAGIVARRSATMVAA